MNSRTTRRFRDLFARKGLDGSHADYDQLLKQF